MIESAVMIEKPAIRVVESIDIEDNNGKLLLVNKGNVFISHPLSNTPKMPARKKLGMFSNIIK